MKEVHLQHISRTILSLQDRHRVVYPRFEMQSDRGRIAVLICCVPQVVALFEEDSDDLEINLASDGMSAGSSSTDTWRPDSENSETNGLPVNDAGGLKLTPLALNKNQRWLFERPGLIDEEQNGVEINQGDVPAKSGKI